LQWDATPGIASDSMALLSQAEQSANLRRLIMLAMDTDPIAQHRKYLYDKSGCNGNLGRVKENMNSLERILSLIRLTETAVAIER
jgi:hypothetical protein